MRPQDPTEPVCPYVIERGIPLWSKEHVSPLRTQMAKAMDRLEVGESFAVPRKQSRRLVGCARTTKKRTGRVFKVRTQGPWSRAWRMK